MLNKSVFPFLKFIIIFLNLFSIKDLFFKYNYDLFVEKNGVFSNSFFFSLSPSVNWTVFYPIIFMSQYNSRVVIKVKRTNQNIFFTLVDGFGNTMFHVSFGYFVKKKYQFFINKLEEYRTKYKNITKSQIPYHIRKNMKNFKKKITMYKSELGRSPSIKQLRILLDYFIHKTIIVLGLKRKLYKTVFFDVVFLNFESNVEFVLDNLYNKLQFQPKWHFFNEKRRSLKYYLKKEARLLVLHLKYLLNKFDYLFLLINLMIKYKRHCRWLFKWLHRLLVICRFLVFKTSRFLDLGYFRNVRKIERFYYLDLVKIERNTRFQ